MAKEVITDLARERRRRRSEEYPGGISQKTADEIARHILAGKPVIYKCHFGFMIEGREGPDGTYHIQCPVDGHPIRGMAEAETVRAAISGWQKRLDEYDAQDDTPS
jgi:hypothetical protein